MALIETDQYGNPIKPGAQPTTPAATTTAAPTTAAAPAAPADTTIDSSGRRVQSTAAQPTAQPSDPTDRRTMAIPGTFNRRPMTAAEKAYDDLPFWSKVADFPVRTMSAAQDDFSFGGANYVDAYAASHLPTWLGGTGKSFQDELAAHKKYTADSQEVAGPAGTAVSAAASIPLHIPGAEAVVNAIAPVAEASTPSLARLATRFGIRGAAGAAEGAGTGAASAYLHDQDPAKGAGYGALYGAGTTLLSPLLGAGTLSGRVEPPIHDTEALQRIHGDIYHNIDTGGHYWAGAPTAQAWYDLKNSPRVAPALVTDPLTGEYHGPNPGTYNATKFIDNTNSARNARQGMLSDVPFSELDAAYKNVRAQSKAEPGAGGDKPKAAYNPAPVLTQGLDDIMHGRTRAGVDIGPELDNAKAAFANSENSGMIDRYQRTQDPTEIRQALYGENSQSFFTPAQRQSMTDVLAAHNRAPGTFGKISGGAATAAATGAGGAVAGPVGAYIAGHSVNAAFNAALESNAARRLRETTDDARRSLTNQAPATGNTFQERINSVTDRDRLTRMLIMGGMNNLQDAANR